MDSKEKKARERETPILMTHCFVMLHESLICERRAKAVCWCVLWCKSVRVMGTWLLTLGCEFVSPQWWRVALHSIEPRRNQNHIRCKLISNRHHYRSAKMIKTYMIIPQSITVIYKTSMPSIELDAENLYTKVCTLTQK